MFTALRISTRMVAQRAGILKLNVAVFYWDFKDSEVRQFSCRTQSWDSGTECCKSTGISKTVECGSSYTELRAGGERTCGLCANSRRKGVWKSGFQFAVCAVTLQSGCHVYRSLLTYPQWICEI